MSSRKIEIEDLRRFKFVSDPQVSPDGSRVAFVLSSIKYEEDRYERHIWIVDVATGEAEQYTFGQGSDTYPRWSPDGRWLLFLSRGRQSDRKTQLWAIPAGGGEARLVADTEEGVMSPRWAPDSRRVLFLSRVWMRERPKSDVKVVRRIKYKADGYGTFEGRRPHVFTVSLDGDVMQVTDGEYDVAAAIWSPDGESIGFVANMDVDADFQRVRDVYVVSCGGGVPRRLTMGSHVVSGLSWDPCGGRLAFIGHNKPAEYFYANYDVWVMTENGDELRNLTEDFDRSLNFLLGSDLRVDTPYPGAVWSPDGGSIYFVTASIPNCDVYKVDVNTRVVAEVTSGRSVDGFSFSADGGVLAFNSMDATHPHEIWVKDGDGERRLTGFNDELLEEVNLSVPERFTFKNEVGDDIDGWIIRPPGFVEGEKYPTALEIHGGPRAIPYGNSILHEFQVLASDDIVVIYTNPRGSPGYDKDYVKWQFGHYYEKDYKDLMDFVDAAIERYPFIDVLRLGVLGGSYGGQMVNWCISHTDRFKAAISFRCVCNWISKFGSSDIGFRQIGNIAGYKDYLGNLEKLVMKIPLRHMNNVKTPTLVVHSMNDFRSPLTEGEQLFTALKIVGVPTELVLFPEESHGLSRGGKPKHREERLRHMLRWFNKYLKPLPSPSS